jgi:flagellar hook protein FlgE
MRGMYAAISGLQAHQTMLDVTANNLSNVDTIGYKSQRTTFVDQLSQELRGASGPTTNNAGTNPVQVGLGVQLGSIDNLMSEGSAQSTGNPLDINIQGDGFFRVGNGQPDSTDPTKALPSATEYTRAGNLTTNTEGYLTTQQGMYVIGKNAMQGAAGPPYTYTSGANDSYIVIPPGSTDIAVGQDGSVTYVDQNTAHDPKNGATPPNDTYQSRVTAGYVSLATFPNESGLERLGGSLWGQTSNSGAAKAGVPGVNGFGTTVSGELEMSNVDMATEFTNMITAERGYQANSRVITTGDQMLQTLVGMGQ